MFKRQQRSSGLALGFRTYIVRVLDGALVLPSHVLVTESSKHALLATAATVLLQQPTADTHVRASFDAHADRNLHIIGFQNLCWMLQNSTYGIHNRLPNLWPKNWPPAP